MVSGKSGDQGADVIASKNGAKAVFQCKRYAAKAGTAAIQQAYAARAYYNAGYSAAVAPGGFTVAAAKLAALTAVHLFLPHQLSAADRVMKVPGDHRVQRVCPQCATVLRVPYGRAGRVVCTICGCRFQAVTLWR